jgi:fermentation-respiration switch protein FrsA (DUF1100 family)
VPYVDRGEARIWYTEQGTGFPMLTLAPGGMRSGVSLWEAAAINPLTAQYKMIAMDQRNAGESTGPLEAGDPWGAYAADQLAVMDHLGSAEIEAFGTAMWAPGFAVSVTRDQVRSFRTPMLVLPGVDEYHPAETGREIAALAPAAELLEPWKDPEHLPAATEAVGRFLRDHSPR